MTTDAQALRRAELAIAWVLRVGVLLAATVIGLGLLLRFVRPSHEHLSSAATVAALVSGAHDQSFAPPRTLATFTRDVAALDPDAVMALGILLLIALPVVRVATTVAIFIIDRDRVFIAITLLVLMILLTGLFFGKTL